jgi:hypothetical protein
MLRPWIAASTTGLIWRCSVSASIAKFCGRAALIVAIIFGGLVIGALTPGYASEAATTVGIQTLSQGS